MTMYDPQQSGWYIIDNNNVILNENIGYTENQSTNSSGSIILGVQAKCNTTLGNGQLVIGSTGYPIQTTNSVSLLPSTYLVTVINGQTYKIPLYT